MATTTAPRKPPVYRYDDILGWEKRCSRCGEYWPADKEFFHSTGKKGSGQLHCYCRDCCAIKKRELKRKRAAVAA